MLKRIIQHHDIRPCFLRLTRTHHPVRIGDNGNPWIQPLVHEYLVRPIPTQNHCRPRPRRLQSLNEPGRYWSFTSPTHGEIPHAHAGERQRVRRQEPNIKRPIPQRRRPAVEPTERR